ncbi:hypothetical protein IJI72_01895 [Candidatus Saccharibacteria bacterium]|nr:hypothetical protein [Candidatus Saccharibacteria bacterium]
MKLSERVKTAVLAAGLALAGISAVMAPSAAYASPATDQVRRGLSATGLGSGAGSLQLQDKVKNIINTILYVVGILSVVVVIYGGVQYTISTGDQSKVTSAKNTIIYGLVGLAISILAYAIVNFVVTKLGS